MSQQCHWCRQSRPSGEMRNGHWVCHVCFDPTSAGRLREPKKCGQCNKKKDRGGEILGQFMCSDCCPMFGDGSNNKYQNQGGRPRKKPKKQVYYVQNETTTHDTSKKHRKKKKEYWKVVIEDVAQGNFWNDLGGDVKKIPTHGPTTALAIFTAPS